MLEKEQAREFVLKNWQEKRESYMTIEYPCMDCFPIYDVMIEQNNNGRWQITIRREQDMHDAGESKEEVAVELKCRRAAKSDEYSHKPGELLLIFVDAKGHEILAL